MSGLPNSYLICGAGNMLPHHFSWYSITIPLEQQLLLFSVLALLVGFPSADTSDPLYWQEAAFRFLLNIEMITGVANTTFLVNFSLFRDTSVSLVTAYRWRPLKISYQILCPFEVTLLTWWTLRWYLDNRTTLLFRSFHVPSCSIAESFHRFHWE